MGYNGARAGSARRKRRQVEDGVQAVGLLSVCLISPLSAWVVDNAMHKERRRSEWRKGDGQRG